MQLCLHHSDHCKYQRRPIRRNPREDEDLWQPIPSRQLYAIRRPQPRDQPKSRPTQEGANNQDQLLTSITLWSKVRGAKRRPLRPQFRTTSDWLPQLPRKQGALLILTTRLPKCNEDSLQGSQEEYREPLQELYPPSGDV